jgi:hypothetical protein
MERKLSLESLDQSKQEWIAEMGKVTRLIDLATILKEEGIETSPASLSRFIRSRAEKRLIPEGEEMKGAVETLAKRNRGEDCGRERWRRRGRSCTSGW